MKIEIRSTSGSYRIERDAPITGREVLELALNSDAILGACAHYSLVAQDGTEIRPEHVFDSDTTVYLHTRAGGGGLEVPSSASPRFWDKARSNHFAYSLMGLMCGLGVILLGGYLFVSGIDGKTTWTARVLGFESRLANAAPGALFMVAGVMIVWITRFNVRIAQRPHGKTER